MLEFSEQQINQTKLDFEQRSYPVEEHQIGGMDISFFVLPQDLCPEIPDFAWRMTGADPTTEEVFGIFGVSESVPDKFRPYWTVHEIIEFTQIGINKQGRCARAEERTLRLLPDQIREEYIQRRISFFTALSNFFRQDLFKEKPNYTTGDLMEADASLRFLQEIQEITFLTPSESRQERINQRELMREKCAQVKAKLAGASDLTVVHLAAVANHALAHPELDKRIDDRRSIPLEFLLMRAKPILQSSDMTTKGSKTLFDRTVRGIANYVPTAPIAEILEAFRLYAGSQFDANTPLLDIVLSCREDMEDIEARLLLGNKSNIRINDYDMEQRKRRAIMLRDNRNLL